MLAGCSDRSSSSSSGSKDDAAPAVSITVFAAASTVDVINEAARQFQAKHSVEVRCSFDASSTLARQIIAGAPADIYLSADERWMDEAEAAGAIDASTRINLLGNELALIAPAASTLNVPMQREFELAAALDDDSRIALADPSHVPAGRYARQALEWMGWWTAVESRIIAAADVRGALRLVERAEAEAGVVYMTDARASSSVKIIAAFPSESHEPVRYPIAATASAPQEAQEFIAFLRSQEMREVFSNAGFVVLTDGR